MRVIFWLAVSALIATIVWAAWYVRRKAEARRLAEEARAAAFMMDFAAAHTPRTEGAGATAMPPPTAPAAPVLPPRGGDIALQKLLFDAAHKAAEAGEPALSIQLYGRLLARYPSTTLADAVRAAVEAQKKKLAKG